MWSRAVWMEEKREEEGVVPTTWINQRYKLVFWPKINARKAITEMLQPTENWLKFPLIKIKLKSGMLHRVYFI